MLRYDRIDIREGIGVAKSNNSKYLICPYWLFNHGFEFQDSIPFGHCLYNST